MSYYINMGRWADDVVGSFEDKETAEAYINLTDWRGSRPKVVGVAKPDLARLTAATQEHTWRVAIRHARPGWLTEEPTADEYTYVEGEGRDLYDAWLDVKLRLGLKGSGNGGDWMYSSRYSARVDA